MGVGRLPIAPKYYHEVPQQFPHQGKPFPDFLKNRYLGDQNDSVFPFLINPPLFFRLIAHSWPQVHKHRVLAFWLFFLPWLGQGLKGTFKGFPL